MKKKRFKFRLGYHGVHYINDQVSHKSYEFVGMNSRDLETLVDLLNEVVE